MRQSINAIKDIGSNAMSLNTFIEDKLNQYAQKIIGGGARSDDLAVGELTFYVTLKRAVSGNATTQDLGMLDAINDTLQELGLVEAGKTFYK
jgi:hypothetical protein